MSKPLSHSLPTVAFRLFKNTFGANDPSSASSFRSILFDVVNNDLFEWNILSILEIVYIMFSYYDSSDIDDDDDDDYY